MSDKSLLVAWRTRIATKIGYLLLCIIWLKSGGWCWCSIDTRKRNNNYNKNNVENDVHDDDESSSSWSIHTEKGIKYTITYRKNWTLETMCVLCMERLEYGMTCMQCNVKWYCHFFFISTHIASVGVQYWSFTILLVPLVQPLLLFLVVFSSFSSVFFIVALMISLYARIR